MGLHWDYDSRKTTVSSPEARRALVRQQAKSVAKIMRLQSRYLKIEKREQTRYWSAKYRSAKLNYINFCRNQNVLRDPVVFEGTLGHPNPNRVRKGRIAN